MKTIDNKELFSSRTHRESERESITGVKIRDYDILAKVGLFPQGIGFHRGIILEQHEIPGVSRVELPALVQENRNDPRMLCATLITILKLLEKNRNRSKKVNPCIRAIAAESSSSRMAAKPLICHLYE